MDFPILNAESKKNANKVYGSTNVLGSVQEQSIITVDNPDQALRLAKSDESSDVVYQQWFKEDYHISDFLMKDNYWELRICVVRQAFPWLKNTEMWTNVWQKTTSDLHLVAIIEKMLKSRSQSIKVYKEMVDGFKKYKSKSKISKTIQDIIQTSFYMAWWMAQVDESYNNTYQEIKKNRKPIKMGSRQFKWVEPIMMS